MPRAREAAARARAAGRRQRTAADNGPTSHLAARVGRRGQFRRPASATSLFLRAVRGAGIFTDNSTAAGVRIVGT